MPTDPASRLHDLFSDPWTSVTHHLPEIWAVITGDPVTVIALIVVAVLATWWVFHWLHKRELDQIPILEQQLSNMGNRLTAKDEDIARLDKEITRLKAQVSDSPYTPSREWPPLNETQQHTLHRLITRSDIFPSQERRIIIVSETSADSVYLAKTLCTIFRSSGWDIGASPVKELSSYCPQGIQVSCPSQTSYGDAVIESLQSSLGPAYGMIRKHEGDSYRPGTVGILIGPKTSPSS